MRRKSDALQGTLDLLVLSALTRAPMHGYAIATHIQAASRDLLRVEEGSLYPALHRMEQSGWVAAEWQLTASNRRARVYRITRAGQKHFQSEQDRWARLTKGVAQVLRYA